MAPLSHTLPPLYAATLLSASVCLSLRVGLFHSQFCSPFSSPSARAPPRGPALSSSDSSVPLPRSLDLFLPTPTGPLSPNLRATPHPISSHFLFPCGDPLYSVPDTTAHSSSCSRSRNTACLGSHVPPPHFGSFPLHLPHLLSLGPFKFQHNAWPQLIPVIFPHPPLWLVCAFFLFFYAFHLICFCPTC